MLLVVTGCTLYELFVLFGFARPPLCNRLSALCNYQNQNHSYSCVIAGLMVFSLAAVRFVLGPAVFQRTPLGKFIACSSSSRMNSRCLRLFVNPFGERRQPMCSRDSEYPVIFLLVLSLISTCFYVAASHTLSCVVSCVCVHMRTHSLFFCLVSRLVSRLSVLLLSLTCSRVLCPLLCLFLLHALF